MRPGLLWVYEGGTQFLGYVLQARSGLVSKQDTLDQYAAIMAGLDTAPGRQWRSLVDTGYDEAINGRRPKPYASWQRGEDYYNEGLLIWMEVDSLLRQQSGGTKSIDDFARAFFGGRDGDYGELTYTLDDVATDARTASSPMTGKACSPRRTTEHASGAPLAGFERNGYRLVYTAEPTRVFTQGEKARGTDLSYSVGMVVDKDAAVTSIIWNSPAFKRRLDRRHDAARDQRRDLYARAAEGGGARGQGYRRPHPADR